MMSLSSTARGRALGRELHKRITHQLQSQQALRDTEMLLGLQGDSFGAENGCSGSPKRAGKPKTIQTPYQFR